MPASVSSLKLRRSSRNITSSDTSSPISSRSPCQIKKNQPAISSPYHPSISATEAPPAAKVLLSVPTISRSCWRQAKQIRNLCAKHDVIMISSLSFATLKKKPSKNTKVKWTLNQRKDAKDGCSLVKRCGTVWTDVEGMKLMHFFPNFISDDLATAVESEILNLTQTISPPSPSGTRYHRFPEWKDSLPPGTPCGVYQYTVYPTRFQVNQPVLSADSASKSGENVNAAFTFQLSSAVTSLSEKLSCALAGIDLDIFDKFRAHVLAAKQEWAVLRAQDKCNSQCYIGVFVLVNVFTDEHLDDNDVIDGWAAMVALGKMEALLYFSDLGAKIPYQRRDVIFFRSALLRHFSEEFKMMDKEARYVLVFTNDQRTFKYLSDHYELVYSSKPE
jgi:hypothetical protein